MPHAEVQHDDHITGQDSGARRQIDVSARWHDGVDSHLLVLQAKDWKDPVDVSDVDAFRGTISDTGADRAIMVCSGGYTQNAIRYARNVGISLYDLHDASSVDWAKQLTIPLLWVDLTPDLQPHLIAGLQAGDVLEWFPRLGWPVSVDGGSSVLTYLQQFVEQWNAGLLPREVGPVHHLMKTADRDMVVRVEDADGVERWRQIREFGLSYCVNRLAWLGHFAPESCRGLIDFLDGQSFIPSFMDVRDIPATRDEEWAEIEDPDDVSVNVRGVVLVSTGHEVALGSEKITNARATRLGNIDD